MTPPDVNCALCAGHQYKFAVCNEHLAKLRAGFVTADSVIVPRALVVQALEALTDTCGGCSRGARLVSEGIHEQDSIGRTLCMLTPAQRAALAAIEEALG